MFASCMAAAEQPVEQEFASALQSREPQLWSVERGIDTLLAAATEPRVADLERLATECEEAATFLRDLAMKLRITGTAVRAQGIIAAAEESGAWDEVE